MTMQVSRGWYFAAIMRAGSVRSHRLCAQPIRENPRRLGGAGCELGLDPVGEERSGQAPGKSYTLEATRFDGTPPMVTAWQQRAGDRRLRLSTLAIAIENAGIDDLRVIARRVPGRRGRALFTNEFLVWPRARSRR